MDDLVDQIMGVMEAAFDPAFGEAWNRRQVSDSLAFPNTRALLVDAAGNTPEPGEEAAGFTLSRRVGDEEELLLIAVRPEARGRSLGSAIMQQFCASAREIGVNRVFLEMREGNAAESFYRRHGFETIGRRRAYYLGTDGTRRDAITFARTLL